MCLVTEWIPVNKRHGTTCRMASRCMHSQSVSLLGLPPNFGAWFHLSFKIRLLHGNDWIPQVYWFIGLLGPGSVHLPPFIPPLEVSRYKKALNWPGLERNYSSNSKPKFYRFHWFCMRTTPPCPLFSIYLLLSLPRFPICACHPYSHVPILRTLPEYLVKWPTTGSSTALSTKTSLCELIRVRRAPISRLFS